MYENRARNSSEVIPNFILSITLREFRRSKWSTPTRFSCAGQPDFRQVVKIFKNLNPFPFDVGKILILFWESPFQGCAKKYRTKNLEGV